MHKRRLTTLLTTTLSLLLLTGCSALLGDSEASSEVDALANSVRLTATANALPTATATPFPTLQPSSENDEGAVADASAAPTKGVAKPAADAETVVPAYIADELARVGVSTSEGELGWEHPPLPLEVEGYLQYQFKNFNLLTLVEDFVISADITWDTDTGLAGCGFAFRADKEEDPNAYSLGISRGVNGSIYWGILENGKPVKQNSESIGSLARIDPSFDWQNGATNRVTIVARGQNFDVYTNGVYIDTLIGQSELAVPKGFIGMLAVSETGKTTCNFTNGWMWHLEK